ncbi:MAG: CoA ester lyase [Comamonadaceae bacterium]|nr:MAG: CoA ester lyase [Comamonadaceae bacterium]
MHPGTARTFLFVPADRPERIGKALDSGADAVIVDLEDAVAPSAKASARDGLLALWTGLAAAQRLRIVIRINAASDAAFAEDLAALTTLAAGGLGGVMIPKVEAAGSMSPVALACPGVPLIPLIESSKAFAALQDIASAPQVVRLAFGHLDLQADLGMDPGADQAELAPARWAVVVASARAGLASPIDGVTPDFADHSQLESDVQRGLRAGFTGKLCIHPGQVPVVHRTLAPSPDRQAWARRVIGAVDAADGGVVQLDGRMVDAPVVKAARQLLARVPRA